MFKNYATTALRNLWKNKIFSIINIAGLAIGISAALVIYLIVQYDFSFDKFEKDGTRIYRVVTNMKRAGNPFLTAGVPGPLNDALRAEATGVEIIAPFQEFNGLADVTVSTGSGQKPLTIKKQGENIIFTDDNYCKLLCYQWIAGPAQNALNEPFRVVLTEERAQLYFPNVDMHTVIGREIIYNDSIRTRVAGIVKNIGANTDFKFNEFISLKTIPAAHLNNNYPLGSWGAIGSSTQLYVKLAEVKKPADIEAQLKAILKKYDSQRNKDAKNTAEFGLQPLSDLHFNTTYGTYGGRTANKPTLYGLLAVASFLLLLGCINFINLSTARASQRAKEIGIRKTMGGSRQQLMFQFLAETFFITLIAALLSVALTPFLLSIFGDFIPAGLQFSLSKQPGIVAFLACLITVVSLLSGLYPAFILSKYNPVLVLKNQAYQGTASTRSAWTRKGLTVSQFFIAQVFIMAAIVTSKQIYFMINSDLGFKKEAIINFGLPYGVAKDSSAKAKRFVLLNKLKAMPGIQLASLGGATPASMGWGASTLEYIDGKKSTETDVQNKYGDTNYLRVYGIKILAGRNITESDTIKEYLINETYLHILGFSKPGDALGKYIGRRGKPIVGVMGDFHQQSLHETIKPLVFYGANKNSYNIHVTLQPQVAGGQPWAATIREIESAFKQLYPESDFTYQFFDDSIAKFYKSEEDIARLLKWATGLAVFISCMGLLGLVIYTTDVRRKEISIRKVLGASVTHIVAILSKDFIWLVMLAFTFAAPVVWWLMNKWLENFAYRTTISWWVFLASGAFMVTAALLTLGAQTFKAATANPVKSLARE